MKKKKKIHIRNKRRALLSGAIGLLIVALLVFGGVKLVSGIFAQDDSKQKLISKVAKDEVKDEDGTKHIVYRTDQWNLRLVNKWNPLPKEMPIDLARMDKGHEIDTRCEGDLLEMLKDCENAGNAPMVVSAYRTFEMQQTYYNGQVQNLIEQGKSEEEAKEEALNEVAFPGTSEHHLGLAVDLVDTNMQNLDESQEKTETQKWLMKNSWKYGFIIRYPVGKEEITGVIYEPWHYRYVGKDVAKEITEKNICLEEYLADL